MPVAMSKIENPTIAAVATAVGGALSVIRLSGPNAFKYLESCWQSVKSSMPPRPRRLYLGTIRAGDGSAVDQCMVVRFNGPESYTGEDMAEISCHGGACVARTILLRLLECGARHAEPGEFTRRAFLNGKLDLTQAEAVADIIAAHSTKALRLANRQLEGRLGQRIEALYSQLVMLVSEIESRMDFPEEDLDWMAPGTLQKAVQEVKDAIGALLDSRRDGEVLRHGVRLVIAGHPNVGKSSLLNAILGRERAIVTHIPGTTRDTLEELAQVRGIPVRLVDTAGIRDAEDIVEQSGIERSLASIGQAQMVLWIFDAAKPVTPQLPEHRIQHAPVIFVGNKTDQLSAPPTAPALPEGDCVIWISALTGAGLDKLYETVEHTVWNRPHVADPDVAVSARHAELLGNAKKALQRIDALLTEEHWELAAVDLREAAEEIGKISGRTASPDILGAIFSRFCIGK